MSSPPTVALGNLMVPAPGSVNPGAYPDEMFDLYSIPAFDLREPEIVRGREVGSSKQVVRPNDVLLSKIVPHIRRSWVVGQDRNRRLIASGEWIVFRSDQVHPAYLRQVLVSDPFHAQFMSTVSGVGGSLLRARPAHVANLQIPLPSLPEQRRIAEVLDHAETLRAKWHAALAQLDSLTQSIFLDMFGDPVTNPRAWPTSRLGDGIATVQIGPFGSLMHHDDYVEGGTPVVNPMHIIGGRIVPDPRHAVRKQKLASLSRYRLREGDVVIGRRGEMGRCAVVGPGEVGMVCGSGAAVIRPDTSKAVAVYIHALLSSSQVRKLLEQKALGVTMMNLNSQILESLVIQVPPITNQQRFARALDQVRDQKARAATALTLMDALFASLQHRAFRGEL